MNRLLKLQKKKYNNTFWKKGESFKYFENGLRYGDNGMDKMKEHTKIKSKD